MAKRTFKKGDQTVSTELSREAVRLLCSGWTEVKEKSTSQPRRKPASRNRRKPKATGGTTKAQPGTAIVGENGPELKVESDKSDPSDN